MKHSFDFDIAVKYDLACAIVYEYINICCLGNQNKEQYIIDGCLWARLSVDKIFSKMPFLTKYQIRNALKVLEDNKLMKVGCFNKELGDCTKWYSTIYVLP